MEKNDTDDTNQVSTATKKPCQLSAAAQKTEAQMHAMMRQITAMQAQLQEEMIFSESPANISNLEDGIVNRTDIYATTGSQGAEQEPMEHENPSIMDGETQETGEMANVLSPAG